MIGHNGIDYGLPCGTPVVAPISGTISYFNDPSGYGNAVFIRGNGLEVVLGHLSRVDVKSGNVSEGQPIGVSGTTGNSTGCHLHFGVRPYPGYNGSNGFYGYVDPQPYLNKGEDNMPTLANREIVRQMYLSVLGREPDPGGLNTYTNQPIDAVFSALYNSPERADFVKYQITKAYNGFLNRDPEPGGLATYTPLPERNYLDAISNSAEAAAVKNRLKGYDPLLKENAELRKKIAELEKTSGGVDQATKDQISETNSIVKKIWEKISNIFK